VIRQRAILAEEKQVRYNAILDAAFRLLERFPDREANMAEVAEEAGVAKGTVYLYFPGKEHLLLALHERNVEFFFSELTALLEESATVGIDDVLALAHTHMIDPPLFLPLGTRCLATLGLGVPAETRMEFGQRLGDWLARAGAGLERHFPELPQNGGMALLRHSYALILGLWQLSGTEACAIPPQLREQAPFNLSYSDNISMALRALWRGAMSASALATATGPLNDGAGS